MEPGRTGKPVGFFGHPVVDGYADLYITSFQMLNSSGFGDYFDGLRGEKVDTADGFLNQLGDEKRIPVRRGTVSYWPGRLPIG